MTPVWRRNKIKQIDEELWQVRINDHTLIEWTKDHEGTNLINVLLLLGDLTVDFMVTGKRRDRINEWVLEEVDVFLQSEFGKDVLTTEHTDLHYAVELFPSLHTWLKMANEKGAFV